MNQECCSNCTHFPGCLTRSTVIFHYFIATGRDRELPEDRSQFNARGFCGTRYHPSTPQTEGDNTYGGDSVRL